MAAGHFDVGTSRHRFTPEETRRGGRAGASRRWARVRFERTHPSNIVNALADAALNAVADEYLAASLSWEQLAELTGMSDDELGGVLFVLLKAGKVRCVTRGAERLYFLPALVREKLRRKRAAVMLEERSRSSRLPSSRRVKDRQVVFR